MYIYIPIVRRLSTPPYRESINMKVDPTFFSKLNEMDSNLHN